MVMCGRVFDVRASSVGMGAEGIGAYLEVPLPVAYLDIIISWAIENASQLSAYAALKVFVIEKKAGIFQDDVPWLIYTPLPGEGGPALVRDIMPGETSPVFKSSVSGEAPVLIQPGQVGRARVVLRMLGSINLGPYAAFWENHDGAPFKVVVEPKQVEANGTLVKALGSYTFDEAFQLVAEPAGVLSTLSEYQGVLQPELTVESW